MAASSLVVKISADLNDFSRNLNKMTKDVREASKTVADIGKTMTIGITLPVTLAAAALSKMALENDEVAKKMEQSFGPAVASVNEHLEKMMQIVPETGTDLQKMALTTNDFAKGLGMAAPKAALLSDQMMTLAANLSASKMISMGDALDKVQGALAGQTRGLKQMGIVIDQAEVQNEAYRLGLVKQGEALTPLGTALATYAVMVKKSSMFEGEANRVHQDAARQWQFLKRDLAEFADATSNLLLPALRAVISVARGLVSALNQIPDWVRSSIMIFGGLLAVLGPTIVMLAKVTEAVFALRTAMTLLAEGSALKKFFAMLTNPEILIAIAAISIAIGGAMALWKKFHKETEKNVPKLDPLIDVSKLMGGATSQETKSPFDQWKEQANAMLHGFESSIAMGDPLVKVFERIVGLNKEAVKLFDQQADKWSDTAAFAREVVQRTREIMATAGVASGSIRGAVSQDDAVKSASRQLVPQTQISLNNARQLIDAETALRTREALINLADTFDAGRVATLEFKEGLRGTSQQFRLTIASLKQQFGNLKASAMSGLEAGLSALLAAFEPITLAFQAFGAVMQGLQPFINALFVPLQEFGRILGLMIEPVLRPLFQALKVFGIVAALAGEVIYQVFSGIARFVGNIMKAIGSAIAKIPFLGGVGNAIKNAGNGMLNVADSFQKTAKDLDVARRQLQDMSFDEARDGVSDLGDAARQTARELIAIPEGFRLALREFQSTLPESYSSRYVPPDQTSGTGGSSGGGNGDKGEDDGKQTDQSIDARQPASMQSDQTIVTRQPVVMQVNGRTLAKIVMDVFRTESQAQFGTTTRISEISL